MRLTDVAPTWAEKIHARLGMELPIEPADVCAHLHVEYRRRVMHPCIDGFYYRTTSGVPFIYVNSRFRLRGRERFTAAHEIGHHLIALACARKTCKSLDAVGTISSPLEVAANRFAANLLMPGKLVRSFWDDLAGNPTYRLEIMADRFEVTRAAMRIRAVELHLLSDDGFFGSDLPAWQIF